MLPSARDVFDATLNVAPFLMRTFRARAARMYDVWYVKRFMPSPGDLIAFDVELFMMPNGHVHLTASYNSVPIPKNEPLLFMREMQCRPNHCRQCRHRLSDASHELLWGLRTLRVPDRVMTRMVVVQRV